MESKATDVFGEPAIGFYVVTAIGIVASAPVAWFYSALFGFHTYLQYRGMTTYGFFIERSEKARKKRAAAKDKAIPAKSVSTMNGSKAPSPQTKDRQNTDVGVV